MENRNNLLNFNRLKMIKQIEENKISSWKIHWVVPERLAFFNGHFPKDPILPSVIILEASLELINFALEDLKPLLLKEVKTAKFFNPIRPGFEIEISGTIKSQTDCWGVHWMDKVKNQKLAAFSLLLESP